jgi:fructose-1-phosphate kinase PfkB-like protein
VVVVSLGERGVLGLDRDGHAWRARVTLDRPVVDAVGSGDALCGGLVVALARDDAFPDVLRLGVACGAANTLVAGAGRCRKADIERLTAHASVGELR